MTQGKQVFPATVMGNLPAIAAPGSIEQYLTRMNAGLATARYLVGPTAPYTTLQSAINQAVADGASPSNPATILVMGGPPLVENITLTTGGITIQALNPNLQTGGVFLIGDVTCTDPGLTAADFPCYWIQGVFIDGKITLNGTATPVNGCPLILYGSSVFSSTPGTVLTNAVTGGRAICTLYNVSLINSATGDLAVSSPAGFELDLRNEAGSFCARTSIHTGFVNVFYSFQEELNLGPGGQVSALHASLFAAGAPALHCGATAGQLSRIEYSTFSRTGAAGPAVTSAGATAPIRRIHCSAFGSLTAPVFPTAGVIDALDWDGFSSTDDNKRMVASVTTADGQVATATPLALRPAQGSFIQVFVNGVEIDLARNDSERTTSSCYFSGNGGVTARSFGLFGTIAAGDLLYWNGSVAGFELAATDRITLAYGVNPNLV